MLLTGLFMVLESVISGAFIFPEAGRIKPIRKRQTGIRIIAISGLTVKI
jgi:hypothetical protein